MDCEYPTTLKEYIQMNGDQTIPYNEIITLYDENQPYEVFVNEKGQIVIPDCAIVYNVHSVYDRKVVKDEEIVLDVVLDPSKGTISKPPERIYTKTWKKNIGHKQRIFGSEHKFMKITLSPLWEFDQEITKDDFMGNGLEYLICNYIDSHTLILEFDELPHGQGKAWEVGPFWVQLKNNLKVRPI